jgi:hypothetical protein
MIRPGLVRAAPLLAALISPTVFALTPLTAARVTPDTTILLGANDQIVTAGEVARHVVPAGNATLQGISGLPASGANVVGYHYAAGHYLVFDTTVVLGGVTFDPRDVAYTDGGGTWSKYFDGVATGIPDGVAIDALALDPVSPAPLLSFDTTVVLDGVTFDPRDVARYSAGVFTPFAVLSARIPAGLNLVGLDALPSGNLLLALDGSGSVGGVAFDDEDILEYTAPDTWEMAYDGSARDADWPAAGIAAFAVEAAAGIRVAPVSGLVTAETGGLATFGVYLLNPPTADVTIALASSDITEGIVAPATLTFTSANWASTQTVTVTGVDDAMADGDVAYGIVTTTSSTDPAYEGLATADVAVVNQDNEPASPGSLQFAVSGQSVAEGAGTVTVTVSRVGGSVGAVSVVYATANGTAQAPGDFTHTGETLYWADGDTADKSFTVAIVDDAAVEGNETLGVTLSSPDGGASLGAPATQTIAIQDNDAPPSPGSLQFSTASQTVGEGVGTVTVTVSRVGGSDGIVAVTYAASAGNATTPEDFAVASGTLTWTDGDTADKTFTVAIVDDAAGEGQESFTLALSAPTGGAGLGAPATQTVAIADNDVATVAPVPALGPLGLALLGGLLGGLAWRARRPSKE